MHKILMSTYFSKQLVLSENTEVVIDQNTTLNNIVIDNNSDITIIIKEGCSLDIFQTINLDNIESHITIINEDSSNLTMHVGICGNNKNDIYIENILSGNNIKSEIRIRVIASENSKTFLKTSGILKEKTLNNEFLEDIKYLNEYPGSIVCLPELLVSSDDVVANHNMTCATFDKEMLFYLESRGLTITRAKELLKNSFIKFGQREDGEYEN